MSEEHYRKLERMYLKANINQEIFNTTTIVVNDESTEISLIVDPKYHHALGAMHGAVYFKLLDDAAYFAVSSIVTDVFILTTSFNINIIRPVSAGKITAKGTIRFKSKNNFVAESTLYDERGREIAFGTGNFAKGRVTLSPDIGYI